MYVTTVWPNLFCQGPLTVKEVRRGYSLYLLIFNHFRGANLLLYSRGSWMVNKRISYITIDLLVLFIVMHIINDACQLRKITDI